MLNKVLTIAADVFETPESALAATSSPDTVSTWDSLRHLSFVVALEEGFGVQFSPEEIEQLLSIELTVALLEEKVKDCAVSDAS